MALTGTEPVSAANLSAVLAGGGGRSPDHALLEP